MGRREYATDFLSRDAQFQHPESQAGVCFGNRCGLNAERGKTLPDRCREIAGFVVEQRSAFTESIALLKKRLI